MQGQIFYIPERMTVLITPNYSVIKKRMDLGIDPKIELKEVTITELKKLQVKGIGFDKISNEYFQQIKGVLENVVLEHVAFHEMQADISDQKIDAKHLVIGDKSRIDISSAVFNNLNEITFLSAKTFKGEIKNKLESVEKLILWYGSNNSNDILSHFPNLKYLQVISANVTELNLSHMHHLETLQLHLCKKLEQVRVPDNIQYKTVIIEKCNKLDVSNLGENVRI